MKGGYDEHFGHLGQSSEDASNPVDQWVTGWSLVDAAIFLSRVI